MRLSQCGLLVTLAISSLWAVVVLCKLTASDKVPADCWDFHLCSWIVLILHVLTMTWCLSQTIALRCSHLNYVNIDAEYPILVAIWTCAFTLFVLEVRLSVSTKCENWAYWHIVCTISALILVLLSAFVYRSIQNCKTASRQFEVETPLINP